MSSPFLPDPLLAELSDFFASQMGLHFPPERWRDLERGFQSAMRLFHFDDAVECANWLLSGPLTRQQIEILASELAVGETYFFRENRSFEVVAGHILPGLIRSRLGREQKLRIWSAGCATGEEAYSIAISIDRILPVRREWSLTILATDINPNFLKKAAEGAYGEWSFRNPPPWLKEHYFQRTSEHRYEVVPRIREMVTFAYLNLAEDTYPSLMSNTNGMDLIFCRNVLMYFGSARAKKVAANFHRALVDPGYLIVSPTETSTEIFSQFSTEFYEGAVLYRKAEKELPRWKTVPSQSGVSIQDGRNDRPEQPVFVPPPQSLPPAPELPSARAGEESIPLTVSNSVYEEALALFEAGNHSEAAGKLRAHLATGEGSTGMLTLLAKSYANLGDLEEARRWTEKAIGMDKLDAGLQFLHATVLQELGDADEAGRALNRALFLDPDFVLAHFALGNLALRRRQTAQAERHFANTLNLLKRYQPDEVIPHSDGLAAGRLGQIVASTVFMEGVAA